MARELTHGHLLAAQLPMKTVNSILDDYLPEKIEATREGVDVTVFLKVPLTRAVSPPAGETAALEIKIPFTARYSDENRECEGAFLCTPKIQIDALPDDLRAVQVNLLELPLASTRVEGDLPAKHDLTRHVVFNSLQKKKVLPVSPMFRNLPNTKVGTFGPGPGTCAQDVLMLFVAGLLPLPLPSAVPFHLSAESGAALLIAEEDLRTRVDDTLAASGLAPQPVDLPGNPDYTLESLTVNFGDGHMHCAGRVTGSFLGIPGASNFEVWFSLLAVGSWNGLLTTPRVKAQALGFRQSTNLGFDLGNVFTGGGVLRAAEEAIPRAIRAVSIPAPGDDGFFFMRRGPTAGVPALSNGVLAISRGGVAIPHIVGVEGRPRTVPYLVGHRFSREFHLSDCEFGRKIKLFNRRTFPTARAAIAAGYDGCATCQPAYNVAAYGYLLVRISRPDDQAWPVGVKPLFTAEFRSNLQRFNVPVEPLPEQIYGGSFYVKDGRLYCIAAFTALVPGKWDVKIQWHTWSAGKQIDIARAWRDRQGARQGQHTEVAGRTENNTLTVTYD
jgi:hypothetical protein